MTNINTGASSETEAMKANLNAMLGDEPVAEPMEEEVVDTSESEEKETKVEETVKKSSKSEEKTKEPEAKEEPEKKVSVHALHEERERRKELQKELAAERARQDRAEERQTKILEALTKPQQEPVYIDPLQAVENKLNEVVGTVNKTIEQQENDKKTQKEFLDFSRKVTAHEQAFVKEKPDYYDAVNFLKANEAKNLALMGYSPEQIEAEINNQAIFIAKKAIDADKNTAEVIFEMARLRGYAAKTPEVKKTVEDVDKGLRASKSLGNAGGKSDNDLTIESMSAADLAELTDEEFNTMFAKIEKQAKRK